MNNFLNNKSVLVTGATGLVGTNMLLWLQNMSQVKVKAIYHTREPQVSADNISYLQADLTNLEDCKRVVEGIDYVMMFAAKIARRSANLQYLIPNLLMNAQMLEAAYQAGVKKFLWLSSVTAYPLSDKPLKEEEMFSADPPDNYFPLGWTTRYIETLCRMYATKLKKNMTTIILRPSAIYGPHADFDLASSHVLSALIRKVVERYSPLEIWGAGKIKKDFIYVDDVVEACLLALEKVDSFTELNIASAKSCSVKELLELILDIDNYSKAQITFDTSRPNKASSVWIDCIKAKRVLGFEAETLLREGIKKTIGWYKSEIVLGRKDKCLK